MISAFLVFFSLIFSCSSVFAAASVPKTVEVYPPATLLISLTIPEYIHLSQHADSSDAWFFDKEDPAVLSRGICVYTNGNSDYRVTFTGEGDGNRFVASDGLRTRAYRVLYDDGSKVDKNVRPGTAEYYTISDSKGFQCNGGSNATLTISMDGDIRHVENSRAYVGILTMQVATE